MTEAHSGPRGRGAQTAVVFACCALLSLGWLALGIVVAVPSVFPALTDRLRAAADDGDDWARGLLAGVARSEPLSQFIPDLALSVLALTVAGALVLSGGRSPAHRLLGIALAASAAAFNLQSGAASQALVMATGFAPAPAIPRFVLPVVTGVSYVLAVTWTPRRDPVGRPSPWVVAALAGTVAALLAAGMFPVSVHCVLLAGLVLPCLGIAGLRGQLRASGSERLRGPARLLFGVLVATVAVEVALAVVTGVLAWLAWAGLALVDPTTTPQSEPPLVLWFWATRLSLPILAAAMLTTRRRDGAVGAQRRFSRGLVVILATALIGCLYVVTNTIAGRVSSPLVAEGAAVAACALAFLPAFLLTERAADRLLYGARPAPYGVLAELAALPRSTTGGLPDLAGVAEAVGQGLGAATCRLTVDRPGLRDRSYQWVRPGEEEAETSLEVPIRHGGQEVGTIAINRAAVAGADDQRQDLLEAIANSLGVVVQAVRAGIDLERQLRAALAHATEIAAARRQAVAEADSERRRLERDLHDGAQHHLVSMSLTLGLVELGLASGRPEQARAALDRVLDQLTTAEAVLARIATGVTAPDLGEGGVVAALRAEFGGDHATRLEVPGGTIARLSPTAEAAVYFCCLESVNNAHKHAPGASVRVRLWTGNGRLHFLVRDEGPGWDPRAGAVHPGRGLRNMTSRLAAIGGGLDVRSAPGRGTEVEGWVPLPDDAIDRPAAVAPPEPELLDQVRAAVRTARDLYHATAHAGPLDELAQRLGRPLRLAVVGPPGPGVGVVADGLRAVYRRGELTVCAVPGLGSTDPGVASSARERVLPDEPGIPAADAHVLLLPPSGHAEAFYAEVLAHARRLRPVQTIGVLVGPGGGADGPPAGATPPVEAGRLGVAVVAGWCPPRPTSGVGSDAGGTGRADLCELVGTRLLGRAEALQARTAVTALAALLRMAPPRGDHRPLAYELDRIRTGSPELAELDLLDALSAGELRVAKKERDAAERLLGLHGTDLPARLGCSPRAGHEELAAVAWRQLARWRRVAAHPTSTVSLRALALVMVQTCERLLSHVPAPRPARAASPTVAALP